jgi:glycosyltransferase involved in cell wall biosynthesis
MSAAPPFVTVIIPVFNDLDRLSACLARLESQTYPPDRFEVIVVDNGSTQDPTSRVSAFGHARCFREDRPSSYAARNRGIREARGDVFAFTDADCLPDSNWIAMGVNALLESPDCGLIAGRIDVFCTPGARPSAVELYDSVRGLNQKHYVGEKGFGATANVFTWRKVVDAVGPFDTELKSCGDMEWGQRVRQKGYKVIYCDLAAVAHPARKTLGQLSGKMRRVAGGMHTLSRKSGGSRAGGMRPAQFFRDVAEVLTDGRLVRFRDRAKVLAIAFYVESVKITERVRLLFGGKPLR